MQMHLPIEVLALGLDIVKTISSFALALAPTGFFLSSTHGGKVVEVLATEVKREDGRSRNLSELFFLSVLSRKMPHFPGGWWRGQTPNVRGPASGIGTR